MLRPQAYSPSNGANRTAVIPTRKRKQRDDKGQLIRVEDDVVGAQFSQHQSMRDGATDKV